MSTVHTSVASALRAPWNALLRAAQRVGYRGADVDVESLLARARRGTGLDDFGDDEFLVPMRLAVDNFKHHAHADATGRQVFAAQVNCALENRLRIRAMLRAHPDIAATPVVAPLFIVGLPRTGTTLLQGLLATVPGLRTPLGWETRLPAAPPGIASARALARHRRRFERDMRFARRVSPRLMASHAFGTDLPEECNRLLFNSLRMLSTCLYPCPAYEDYLYATHFRGAYDFHAPHLQVLAYRQPACTWVLKAPAHMASLAELLRVYPDARIVFTHRDAIESVPSTARLAECLHTLLTPTVDRAAIGARVLATLGRMHDAARAERERWPAEAAPWLDVEYAALVRSPLATVRGILGHFGIPEPAGTGAAVMAYLRRSRRTRVTPERFTCRQFAISEDAARAALPDLRMTSASK